MPSPWQARAWPVSRSRHAVPRSAVGSTTAVCASKPSALAAAWETRRDYQHDLLSERAAVAAELIGAGAARLQRLIVAAVIELRVCASMLAAA